MLRVWSLLVFFFFFSVVCCLLSVVCWGRFTVPNLSFGYKTPVVREERWYVSLCFFVSLFLCFLDCAQWSVAVVRWKRSPPCSKQSLLNVRVVPCFKWSSTNLWMRVRESLFVLFMSCSCHTNTFVVTFFFFFFCCCCCCCCGYHREVVPSVGTLLPSFVFCLNSVFLLFFLLLLSLM